MINISIIVIVLSEIIVLDPSYYVCIVFKHLLQHFDSCIITFSPIWIFTHLFEYPIEPIQPMTSFKGNSKVISQEIIDLSIADST